MKKFKAKHLTSEQIAKVTAAVRAAELKTQGEIVPMIVKRSSATGHVPHFAFLLLLSCSLVSLIGLENWYPLEQRWIILIVVVLVCFAAGLALAPLTIVQRWLTPDWDMQEQVWRRAQSEWAAKKLQKTKERTGILIFVSVMERKAIVLADEGIAKHYPRETWQQVIDKLGEHLHRGEWVTGFEQAIQLCGEILAKHLPAGDRNPNEITDQLIIKE
jgi:putative membrane protein